MTSCMQVVNLALENTVAGGIQTSSLNIQTHGAGSSKADELNPGLTQNSKQIFQELICKLESI